MSHFFRLGAAPHEEEEQSFLAECPPSSEPKTCGERNLCRTIHCSVTLPWLVSLALFVCLVVQTRTIRSRDCSPISNFWRPWEIEPAKREIPATWKEVKFTAGLMFNETGGLERIVDPELPAYVGTPTPEMDTLWHDLTETIDIFLTEDEANAMGGGMTIDPESGLYMGEIQMTHDIHCLNMLRMALNSDYYPKMRQPTLENHLDHCIDSLRESLMCSGDMTIIKSSWSDNRGAMMPDFQNYHTCRDMDALKTWARGRNAANPKLWPGNAERLLAGRSH